MNLKNLVREGKGASDITPLLKDGTAFNEMVTRIAGLFNNVKVDAVAAIEGRGFILGGAVALKMGCGVIPLRYPGKLKNETYSQTFIDYSGKEKKLQIHKDAISNGQNILIVDDWLETGATIKTAIKLVEQCNGKIVGVGIFMDDSSDETKELLSKYNYKFLEQVNSADAF